MLKSKINQYFFVFSLVLIGVYLVFVSKGFLAKNTTFVTIGTGGVTGVYYPAGGAICRLVNKGKDKHGIRCNVESTGGSIYNLNTIATGELDMGIVQSDWQYHAYNGTKKFIGAANKNLRSVFAVHAEPFTVVARLDSGIKVFTDLKGKRINIGDPGSGTQATMKIIMDKIGWTKADFKLVSELKSSEQANALCDNKVDAIIFATGHPSGTIKEATTSCDTTLVSVEGNFINELIKDNTFYKVTVIPGGMYKGSPKDTKTFGVTATFVSSTKTADDVIYTVVKSVFENFDDFKKLHPTFANLKKAEMIKEGLSAPLHNGASKYYKAVNLLK
jgi:TRAP transporter TAXI family solute receptor